MLPIGDIAPNAARVTVTLPADIHLGEVTVRPAPGVSIAEPTSPAQVQQRAPTPAMMRSSSSRTWGTYVEYSMCSCKADDDNPY